MKTSIVFQQHRRAIRDAVLQWPGIENPRVFGSVLRGDDRDGSDLDLLVDVLPGTTLFDLGGLQDQLEELIGVRVDLLTPADLPISFREQVLSEAQSV